MGKDRLETGRGRREGSGVVKGPGKKNATAAARQADNKRWFYIALAVIVVAGIAMLSYLSTKPSGAVSQIDTTLPPIPNQGHAMGSDSAPLEVVEFGDFECPACGSFSTLTEPDVRARLINTGLIRFRFMDFPLSIHPNSPVAHLASWCAGDQNRYWEMHDAIFANQDRWNTQATNRPDKILSALANQVGLNMEQYETCMSSRKFQQQIRANVDEGVKRKVAGTPNWFIGKLMIPKPLSYDEFKRYVDQELPAARAAQAAANKTTPAGTKTAPK
jgi:protein-disulfide isomerase